MKGFKIYWIITVVLLLIYIIAQLNRPKEIDWTETLSSKEKSPFGTYVLKDRLKDIFPGSSITSYRRPVYNVIAEDSVKNAAYIIIAPGLEFSKPDYEQLIKYIKKGNDVLIASEYFGELFTENLKIKTRYVFKIKDDPTPVNFTNKHLNPGRKYTLKKGIGNMYFDAFDTAKTIVLGENSSHKANFIKVALGRGSLYLITNPRYFSNYSLLQRQGQQYAATALSFVKNTRQILFDEYYTQGEGGEETPMRVFLNNPALRWAYYIAIFSLMLFVIYEVKRRQRIIPVIEPLTNSTMEFVTVIGQLYYEKKNNADIAHKKIIYLLTWLRDKHNVKTQISDDEFSKVLVQKLGLKDDFVVEITGYLNYINECSMVTDKELIKLNYLTEKFYNQLQ